MKWYQTQIIGVIVGGFITMSANWLLKWNENRIEIKNIKAGIKTEISVFADFIESGLTKVQEYKQQFELSKKIPNLKMTGQFDFSFIDSNMSKIGALDENLMKKIIELRGLKEAYTAGSTILFDTIILYNKGNVGVTTVALHLTAIEESMIKIKTLSDEIIT